MPLYITPVSEVRLRYLVLPKKRGSVMWLVGSPSLCNCLRAGVCIQLLSPHEMLLVVDEVIAALPYRACVDAGVLPR